jgi:membrane-anchored protein YejM (alkaline phosphatase superfamily)
MFHVMREYFYNFIKKNRILLRWILWFGFANSIILWLAATHYIPMLFPLDLPDATFFGKVLVTIYIVITYFSFFTLWAMLPLIIVLFPLVCVTKRPLYLQSTAVLISSFVLIFIIIDSHIFLLYRFHINMTLLRMMFAGHFIEFFAFSWLELGAAILFVFLIGLLEIVIAKILWFWALKEKKFSYEKPMAATLASFFLFSYVTFGSSVSFHINAFSQQAKVFPLYTQMIAALFPQSDALERLEKLNWGYYSQLRQVSASVQYPLYPINGKAAIRAYNILVIVIDAWRFDALTKQITPHLADFSEHAWQFKNHFSGGNGSQAGIFSLFYSLPENYWDSMLKQKVSPVLIHILYQRGYQMGIYGSAPLNVPRFDLTVFREVRPLQVVTKGDTPVKRDRMMTQEFINFLKTRKKKKPFFGFLFYNTAHSYCFTQDFPKIFQPSIRHCYRLGLSNSTDPIPYQNRYNNALHFVDSEVNKVLHVLKKDKLISNTIVIVTGDHGQEFNDNHRDYWEHAGNFTRYQTQTPLIVYWPGESPRVLNYTTTHYDIVPTLLRHALGIKNPISDYSIGYDLLDAHDRPFIVMGSYINFGVRSKDQITVLYPSGTFQVEDLHARPLSSPPTLGVIRYAMEVMRQYYRPSP